jgi:hypothetical protein
MRRLAIAAAATVLLAAPAYAQFSMGGDQQRDRTRYTEEQRRTEAEVEKAYKDAVKNTRGTPTETYDPWRTIRPGTPAETKNKPQR